MKKRRVLGESGGLMVVGGMGVTARGKARVYNWGFGCWLRKKVCHCMVDSEIRGGN